MPKEIERHAVSGIPAILGLLIAAAAAAWLLMNATFAQPGVNPARMVSCAA